ncbi:MAG: NAD(P)-binding protein [Planctomycetaceae bacterium]|nr:NAD(P)-binding protein [Planctomycetaceae bacterium]
MRDSGTVTEFDAIIVGSGIAGLGCARKLHDLGFCNFLVIGDELGGRIPVSTDGQVNYGAFYVRSDYRNFLPYVTLKRRISTADVVVMPNGHRLNGNQIPNWRTWWQRLRFWWFLRRFARRYQDFRIRSERMSQKKAMDADPWLKSLFREPARDLVGRLNLGAWTETHLEPLVCSTAFRRIDEVSSGYFAACCLPLIIPTYEFEFQLEKLISPFFSRLLRQTVTMVEASAIGSGWMVTTESGETFSARNLVLATPMNVTRTLVAITEDTNPPSSAYMVHVRGTLRPKFRERSIFMFPATESEIGLVHEANETVLLYSRRASPDLSRYFENYEVIARRHWDPAFFIGTEILEADRGDGLYLIGDHNVCSIEDAMISGMYVARCLCAADQESPGERPAQSHTPLAAADLGD